MTSSTTATSTDLAILKDAAADYTQVTQRQSSLLLQQEPVDHIDALQRRVTWLEEDISALDQRLRQEVTHLLGAVTVATKEQKAKIDEHVNDLVSRQQVELKLDIAQFCEAERDKQSAAQKESIEAFKQIREQVNDSASQHHEVVQELRRQSETFSQCVEVERQRRENDDKQLMAKIEGLTSLQSKLSDQMNQSIQNLQREQFVAQEESIVAINKIAEQVNDSAHQYHDVVKEIRKQSEQLNLCIELERQNREDENKQLAAKIEGLTSLQSQLSDQLNQCAQNLQREQSAAQEDSNALSKIIEQVNDSSCQHHEVVQELQRQIERLNQCVELEKQNRENDGKQLAAKIEGLASQQPKFSYQLNERFQNLQRDCDQLNHRVELDRQHRQNGDEQLAAKVEGLTSQQSKLSDDLNQRFQALQRDCDQLNQRVVNVIEIDRKLGQNSDEQIAATIEGLTSQQSTFCDQLNQRWQALQRDCDQLNQRVEVDRQQRQNGDEQLASKIEGLTALQLQLSEKLNECLDSEKQERRVVEERVTTQIQELELYNEKLSFSFQEVQGWKAETMKLESRLQQCLRDTTSMIVQGFVTEENLAEHLEKRCSSVENTLRDFILQSTRATRVEICSIVEQQGQRLDALFSTECSECAKKELALPKIGNDVEELTKHMPELTEQLHELEAKVSNAFEQLRDVQLMLQDKPSEKKVRIYSEHLQEHLQHLLKQETEDLQNTVREMTLAGTDNVGQKSEDIRGLLNQIEKAQKQCFAQLSEERQQNSENLCSLKEELGKVRVELSDEHQLRTEQINTLGKGLEETRMYTAQSTLHQLRSEEVMRKEVIQQVVWKIQQDADAKFAEIVAVGKRHHGIGNNEPKGPVENQENAKCAEGCQDSLPLQEIQRTRQVAMEDLHKELLLHHSESKQVFMALASDVSNLERRLNLETEERIVRVHELSENIEGGVRALISKLDEILSDSLTTAKNVEVGRSQLPPSSSNLPDDHPGIPREKSPTKDLISTLDTFFQESSRIRSANMSSRSTEDTSCAVSAILAKHADLSKPETIVEQQCPALAHTVPIPLPLGISGQPVFCAPVRHQSPTRVTSAPEVRQQIVTATVPLRAASPHPSKSVMQNPRVQAQPNGVAMPTATNVQYQSCSHSAVGGGAQCYATTNGPGLRGCSMAPSHESHPSRNNAGLVESVRSSMVSPSKGRGRSQPPNRLHGASTPQPPGIPRGRLSNWMANAPAP